MLIIGWHDLNLGGITSHTLQVWVENVVRLGKMRSMAGALFARDRRIIVPYLCLHNAVRVPIFVPVLLCLLEVGRPQQLAGLQVHQLWHVLVQDQVFEGASYLSASENQQEKAEVGDQKAHVYSDGQDQKCGRVCILLLLLGLVEENVCYQVQGDIAALDEEDEADARQVRAERPRHRHQVEVCLLDQRRNLLDETALQDEEDSGDASFT